VLSERVGEEWSGRGGCGWRRCAGIRHAHEVLDLAAADQVPTTDANRIQLSFVDPDQDRTGRQAQEGCSFTGRQHGRAIDHEDPLGVYVLHRDEDS